MTTTLIKGGKVFDAGAFDRADLLVMDGDIVEIGKIEHDADETINATGMYVAPGFIETAMTDALGAERRSELLSRIPAARLGNAEDVAAAVAFLASEEAGYVTGHTLHVNGGMTMV